MESKVKRLVLILSVILAMLAQTPAVPLSVSTQQGQNATSTKTATATKPASDINSRVLPNGLEIVTLEDHSVPLVTVELAVRNGSFTETPGLNGLSHLYETMFFKAGPQQAVKNDSLRGIDSLGIVYNGETHEEVVNYYFTTTTPNFPVALRFMRDQAMH